MQVRDDGGGRGSAWGTQLAVIAIAASCAVTGGLSYMMISDSKTDPNQQALSPAKVEAAGANGARATVGTPSGSDVELGGIKVGAYLQGSRSEMKAAKYALAVKATTKPACDKVAVDARRTSADITISGCGVHSTRHVSTYELKLTPPSGYAIVGSDTFDVDVSTDSVSRLNVTLEPAPAQAAAAAPAAKAKSGGKAASAGSTSAAGAAAPAKAAPVQKVVQMNGSKFLPAALIVPVGSTVTWMNAEVVPHNVVGGPMKSPMMQRGAKFSHTFTEAGNVSYLCELHPGMTGTVTVT